MLEAVRQSLIDTLPDDAVVLDIGGWADPLGRADWVMDLMSYETRGLYEQRGWIEPRREPERFTADTWIQRDICDREPFPFEDDEIDFVVCGHTLEDIRDPVWVCSEMQRIAKAGYIEVPSRLEEQTWGVHGPWVGWTHHRWLIDVTDDSIEFVFKLHTIHSNPRYYFPQEFLRHLSDEERVSSLRWEGSFRAGERVLFEEREATQVYLGEFVKGELAARGLPTDRLAKAPLRQRIRRRAAAARGAAHT